MRACTNSSEICILNSKEIVVQATRDNAENMTLTLPGSEKPVHPTHWSFDQLASITSATATYLRSLPTTLAAINLQYGLQANRSEKIKTLETIDGRTVLRAVTGPDYGRIYDHELVEAVQKIARNDTGDTSWKVPGVLDWSTGIYNPNVDISKDTTRLYASDRDVFLFLVDDLNPIEAGKLPDGSPDLYFRVFYCWNSEVDTKTLCMVLFYLRAVCQNRNLWGVEDFQEIKIRHSKYAANRFAYEGHRHSPESLTLQPSRSSTVSARRCSSFKRIHYPKLKGKNMSAIMSQSAQESLSATFATKILANVLTTLTKVTPTEPKVDIYKSMKIVPDPVDRNFAGLSATNSEYTVTHRVPAELSGDFSGAVIDMHKLSMLLKKLPGGDLVTLECVEDDVRGSIGAHSLDVPVKVTPALFDNHRTHFEKQLAEPLPTFNLDTAALKQVFTRLVDFINPKEK